MQKKLFITASLIVFTCLSIIAQVDFRIVTDAKKVTLNGYFEVQFVVENGKADDFQAPSFQGLKVMGGPNQSMSTSIINGVRSSEISYGYVLQPTRLGKVTIGRASAKIGGKTYRTEPVIIEVGESKSRPQGDEEGNIQDIFLKAELEAEEVYIGQQVPLNYRIYTLENINSYNILQESDYQGFYAEDLRRFNAGVLREVIDGQQYTTKVLKRIALFPQQTGELTVNPMQMQVGISKDGPRNPRDYFFSSNVLRLTIASDPLKFNVKPLPDNPPSSFTGAVGYYTFSSSIDKRRLTTDDALSIRVNIAGNGDVKRVQPPIIDLGAAFDVYEPRVVNEQMRENAGEIQSIRVYEYLALPKVPGNYDFELTFSYFNPEVGTYETIKSQEYAIEVGQGSNTISDNNPIPDLEDEDIHFIKSIPNLQKPSKNFFGSGAFYALTALPFLLLIGAFSFKEVKRRKENIDPILLKNRMAQKVAQKHLAKAQKHLTAKESRAFYDEVSKAMLGYVNDKLNIPNSQLTKDNVIDRLEELGAEDTHIQRFMQIIKTCEIALFARKDSEEDMQATYNDAVDVLVKMEIGKG